MCIVAVDKNKGVDAVLEKIAGFADPYRDIGERVHRVIVEAVPELAPKLFYGMPGYALGKRVLVFFRLDGENFSFGLSEHASHEIADGATDKLLPSAWFLREIDDATERRIGEIVRRAVVVE